MHYEPGVPMLLINDKPFWPNLEGWFAMVSKCAVFI